MGNTDFLTIHFRRSIYHIPIDSILFIESDLRKVLVHTPGKVYSCYQRLAELEKLLYDSGFVRCHQSYLVPLDKIEYFTSNQIYIQNAILPISKRYYKEVDKLLTDYGILRGKPFLQPSVQQSDDSEFGSLICVIGSYRGMVLHLCPDQRVLVGRNGNVADLVINLPEVSRIHCSLTYHANARNYEVWDQSRNGTYINGNRLLPSELYTIPIESEICFGNKETIFKLC